MCYQELERQNVLIGEQETGRVKGVIISASGINGISVTVNGRTARLAVVTADGEIVTGDAIAKEVFNVSVNAYRDFLRGMGYLHTHSTPPPTDRADPR
ncbi:hypothetical protein [Ramlibacter sp. Leaf400]|uniref:hypothetical protein n=1 Tax=Ramlibacter sp. Leaf400 TaxID=1736365 RepID=UPI0007009DA2|nr:hypothetical protein [Ramlibacter sp. Leaf400]KQT10814.1 hypothetical protein ASG30_08365 [Ramlibacter sp. Leaf400]